MSKKDEKNKNTEDTFESAKPAHGADVELNENDKKEAENA